MELWTVDPLDKVFLHKWLAHLAKYMTAFLHRKGLDADREGCINTGELAHQLYLLCLEQGWSVADVLTRYRIGKRKRVEADEDNEAHEDNHPNNQANDHNDDQPPTNSNESEDNPDNNIGGGRS